MGRAEEAAARGHRTRPRVSPTLDRERDLWEEGYAVVAGMDEVGRGAWAGPVSVGVAVLKESTSSSSQPPLLRDSKMLSEKRREEIFDEVGKWCAEWSVGHADARECDRWGMVSAIQIAGYRALSQIKRTPEVLLVDGPVDLLMGRPAGDGGQGDGGQGDDSVHGASKGLPGFDPQSVPALPRVIPVTRGDETCASISAASVLAKVVRDRLMREQRDQFPAFGFERNKGYPSPEHRLALRRVGLTPIHRRSWSFARDL